MVGGGVLSLADDGAVAMVLSSVGCVLRLFFDVGECDLLLLLVVRLCFCLGIVKAYDCASSLALKTRLKMSGYYLSN